MEETNQLILQHCEIIGIPEALIVKLREATHGLPPLVSAESALVQLVSASTAWSTLVTRSSKSCSVRERVTDCVFADSGVSHLAKLGGLSMSKFTDVSTGETCATEVANVQTCSGCYVSLADLHKKLDARSGSSFNPNCLPQSTRCYLPKLRKCLCLQKGQGEHKKDASKTLNPSRRVITCSCFVRILRTVCCGICGQCSASSHTQQMPRSNVP